MRHRRWYRVVLPAIAAGSLLAPGMARDATANPWGADYFPNVELITHEGKKVRFFDDLIKGKVVLINFIFTHCKEACPLETARLREVQKILGKRVGKDVFMYSITVDPERDTPEVLARYRKRFGVQPGWVFLTGKREEIILLRQKLGVFNSEEKDGNLSAHTLTLTMGNQATGRWMRGSPFENPEVLAKQLGEWLHNWKQKPTGGKDYAEAPTLLSMSEGERLFRMKCSSCHDVSGKGVRLSAAGPAIGPDLKGVTKRRSRQWLARFIAEPDKMVEEKDPDALALYAEYDGVLMPNLKLSKKEVEQLLQFLDAAK